MVTISNRTERIVVTFPSGPTMSPIGPRTACNGSRGPQLAGLEAAALLGEVLVGAESIDSIVLFRLPFVFDFPAVFMGDFEASCDFRDMTRSLPC